MSESTHRTLLFLGGVGGMEHQYRQVAQLFGYELSYHEKSVPRQVGCPSVIFVVASVVSHPMREKAAALGRRLGCGVVYLRGPSLSQMRAALERLEQRVVGHVG